MKVLITGASGFLGEHIVKELKSDNKIVTISRKNGDINVDLATGIPELETYDTIIHCAGKAHSIPRTDSEVQAFFDVNLIGTDNLLKGLEKVSPLPSSFVFISTVAVYGCSTGELIDETHPLSAKDPYGLSKLKAEELVHTWCLNNSVICTILRLPLLVGKNPPGNLGAMIRGIGKGYYFNIGGGQARKSMVLASDVAKFIPIVAKIGGIYNLTDGKHPSFAELSVAIANQLDKSRPINIPIWIANLVSSIGNFFGPNVPINTNKLKKITSDLTFNDEKARTLSQWQSLSVIENLKI